MHGSSETGLRTLMDHAAAMKNVKNSDPSVKMHAPGLPKLNENCSRFVLDVIQKKLPQWRQEAKTPPDSTIAKEKPDDEHIREFPSTICFRGYIEHTEHRAINLLQLVTIFDFVASNCYKWRQMSKHSPLMGQPLCVKTFNLYDMNSWVILPLTEKGGPPRPAGETWATRETCSKLCADCAMVELLADGEQVPFVFVSHWWGEAVIDFLACISYHMYLHNLKEEVAYWICAYANRQFSLGEDVTLDPKESSFYSAMKLSRRVLLILDSESKVNPQSPATPFTRIWCAFEESIAIKHLKLPLDIACSPESPGAHPTVLVDGLAKADELAEGEHLGLTPFMKKTEREKDFPFEVIKKAVLAKLENASASQPADRIHILNSLAGRDDLEATPPEHHERFDEVNIRLHSVFAQAALAQAALPGRSPEDLNMLASALKEDRWCEVLKLRFSSSSDVLAEALARSFPPNLKELDLDFSEFHQSQKLAKMRKDSAEAQRHLNMQDMRGLGKKGDIKGISGSFFAARVDEDRTDRKATQTLQAMLRVQEQERHAMHTLTDVGFLQMCRAMPSSVIRLAIDCRYCADVSESSLARLGECLPRDLQVLKMCLGDATSTRCDPRAFYHGLSAFSQKMPASVSSLTITIGNLNFESRDHLQQYLQPSPMPSAPATAPDSSTAKGCCSIM